MQNMQSREHEDCNCEPLGYNMCHSPVRKLHCTVSKRTTIPGRKIGLLMFACHSCSVCTVCVNALMTVTVLLVCQMSLCVCLSTWLVVCCWCHVLYCLLSDPALLVISLLFQLRHLCLPHCPPHLSPHLFSWCLQSCAVSLFNVRCVTSCVCVMSVNTAVLCLSVLPPRGVFCSVLFLLIIKRPTFSCT